MFLKMITSTEIKPEEFIDKVGLERPILKLLKKNKDEIIELICSSLEQEVSKSGGHV